MNRHYYHCATKGLETDVLFSSREQFIAGMNRIALCHLSFPQVIIIACVLMDNHIHLILHGTEEDCRKFMDLYKRLTEIYLSNHSPSERSKDWNIGRWIIPNREKLAEKICYVLRNPLAAGMGIHPSLYLWGSGSLMFAGKNQPSGSFKQLGNISAYQQRKLFNSKMPIPPEWLVNDEGMIWPGSYVAYSKAEAAFDNIHDYMYQLNKRNEDAINLEMYGADVSLHDNDLMQIASTAANELFGEKDINLLSLKERLELCRNIRRTHGADIKQMARLFHIRANELKSII